MALLPCFPFRICTTLVLLLSLLVCTCDGEFTSQAQNDEGEKSAQALPAHSSEKDSDSTEHSLHVASSSSSSSSTSSSSRGGQIEILPSISLSLEKSSSSAPSVPDVPPEVAANTLSFLIAFGESIPLLRRHWVGRDYCSWIGVTCSTFFTRRTSLTSHPPSAVFPSVQSFGVASVAHEVKVDLHGMQLQGTCPEIPFGVNGSLIALTSLDLSGNAGLVGSLCRWSSLYNLRTLNLTGASFSGVIPPTWRRLRSLTELHIASQQICGSLPNWTAAALPALRRIDLSNNRLGGSLSREFASLAREGSLIELRLQRNPFCGCLPATWSPVALLWEAAKAANARLLDADCAAAFACREEALTCAAESVPPAPETTPAPDEWARRFWYVILLIVLAAGFGGALLALCGRRRGFCAAREGRRHGHLDSVASKGAEGSPNRANLIARGVRVRERNAVYREGVKCDVPCRRTTDFPTHGFYSRGEAREGGRNGAQTNQRAPPIREEWSEQEEETEGEREEIVGGRRHPDMERFGRGNSKTVLRGG